MFNDRRFTGVGVSMVKVRIGGREYERGRVETFCDRSERDFKGSFTQVTLSHVTLLGGVGGVIPYFLQINSGQYVD